MDRKVFKFFVFFSLAALAGSIPAFAQDDDSQQVLNQIHDLESKMRDDINTLDQLKKEASQTDAEIQNAVNTVPAATPSPIVEEAIQPPQTTETVSATAPENAPTSTESASPTSPIESTPPTGSTTESIKAPAALAQPSNDSATEPASVPQAAVVSATAPEAVSAPAVVSTTATAPAAEPSNSATAEPINGFETTPGNQAASSTNQATAPSAAPANASQLPAYQAASLTSTKPPNIFKVTGEARAEMGLYGNGTWTFDRANFDLNERNYRVLSNAALNNNINTYDPAIYSRLKVVMDASVASAVVSMHLNLTVDPWSFTSKSNTQLIHTLWGDDVRVQYLGWGSEPYTLATVLNGVKYGDAFLLNEIKSHGSTIPAVNGLPGNFSNQFGQTDILNIPAAELTSTFQPVREAWVDIKPTDQYSIRIFPMAYQDQALNTDDPLKLSGNREWWDASPWLNSWQPGNFNSGATPPTFTKGYWDDTLAFFTRDSDGLRLTALRGVSVDASPTDETSIKATIASPKTLWQDYGDITSVPAAVRLKQFLGDWIYVGGTATAHQGYNDGHLDAENYAGGGDAGIILIPGFKLATEFATSRSMYDESFPAYTSKFGGNAYYAALEGSSNPEDMISKDYFGYQPIEKSDTFYKTKLYVARMDTDFESSLSTYHQTRDDSFWADHLTFYPSEYRYMPGISPPQSEADFSPFAIGDGIDYGRTVFGWRTETNWLNGKLQGLEDVRQVTNNDGSLADTDGRLGLTYSPTEKFTTKGLFLIESLPKTRTWLDPYITDGVTGQYVQNVAIQGGQDPSVHTVSGGARYQLTDWSAINGVWEYTNNFQSATGEYPQGDLNSSFLTNAFQSGKVYDTSVPFLYDQGYFDQPPYSYHNIFKGGLELTPSEKWHVYLDFTRNPNKFAGNIDDNMTHYGIETSYVPTPKIGFFARYVYSTGYDINRLVNDNVLQDRGYSNFSFEMRMVLPKDVTVSLQYGVGPAYNIQTVTSNPTLAYYSTAVVQTQHLVRLIIDKKF